MLKKPRGGLYPPAVTLQAGEFPRECGLIAGDRDDGLRLQIFVPPGQLLLAGIKVTIDQEEPITLPYVWCFTNVCVAANSASPALLRAMLSGRKMTLEVVDSAAIAVTAVISLDEFAVVNQGPPTQTFEQNLESK
jgi:invasion protein IalB